MVFNKIKLDINTYLDSYNLFVNETDVNERIRSIKGKDSSHINDPEVIKKIISFIDLTTLEGKDTRDKVHLLCNKAINPDSRFSELPHTAAVCVYPSMVQFVKEKLENSAVHIASVAGGFPSGQTPINIKVAEAKQAISDGADEIDLVINRGSFLSGNYQKVFDEIQSVKEVCREKTLKVILETGELETFENIRKASFIALKAGADFIKTSTGKTQPAATLPVTLVMLNAIKDFYKNENRAAGIKPAGGIKTTKDAISYYELVKEIMGNDWLNPKRFRIGASSLLNDLIIKYNELMLDKINLN